MIATVETPCGSLWISGDSDCVVAISWNPIQGRIHAGELDWVVADLNAYFSKEKKVFDGSLILSGANPVWSRKKRPFRPETFYHKVLYVMADIPYGQVQSYSDLARAVGSPLSGRAVGNVCKRNPLPVMVPCHRVVAKHGIGGYSSGIYRKEILLNLEQNADQNPTTALSSG